MSDEIKFNLSVEVNKDGVPPEIFQSGELSADMAGKRITRLAQAIALTPTALELGDLATDEVGLAWFKNHDTENFVTLSLNADGSAPFATILAREIAFLRLATGTIYATADTAPVNLAFGIIEK